MRRTVLPEILDDLPHDAPDARRMRGDLRRLNALLGGHRWIPRQVAGLARPGDLVAELGAGDGSLALRLAPLLAARGARYAGIDLAPRPPGLPATADWDQADLRTSDAAARADIVVANLILHQFVDDDLRAFGRRLRARTVVASEPARRRRFRWGARLLGPFLHPGTRHDARVSIGAGFRAGELPTLLGLASGWVWREHETPLGATRSVGTRT